MNQDSRPFAVALFLLLFTVSAAAERVDVAKELERLRDAHKFSLIGLDNTLETKGRADREQLLPRLKRLLEGFDHVIVQKPEGGVDRVIILGAKVPFVPQTASVKPGAGKAQGEDIVLPTTRRGTQQLVEIAVEGEDGSRTNMMMVVDTGADFVVLPESISARLGIDPDSLTTLEMQTANGKVDAQIGSLAAVWLGEQRVPDIKTAFIPDDKLGDTGLLGMSLLGRFRMTIDDSSGSLTLGAK